MTTRYNKHLLVNASLETDDQALNDRHLSFEDPCREMRRDLGVIIREGIMTDYEGSSAGLVKTWLIGKLYKAWVHVDRT